MRIPRSTPEIFELTPYRTVIHPIGPDGEILDDHPGVIELVSEPVNLSNLRDDDTRCSGSVSRLTPIPCGRLAPSPTD